MAPIYETDVAEERWSKAQWDNFELWEKVKKRHKRRKKIWILITVVLFFILLSIPVLIERVPEWQALIASRRLADELVKIKREVALHHQAFRITFKDGSLDYQIERAERCHSTTWNLVREGALSHKNLRILRSIEATEFGIQNVMDTFCYDPWLGFGSKVMIALVILPAKDLTVGNMDRVATVLISGSSAEIAFE